MAKVVLILGARGRLGRALVQAFAGAGWQVLAQVRPPASLPTLPGVQCLSMPTENVTELARAARGASFVVHAMNPPYVRWAAEALPLMRAALAVAQQLGARLMFPGNVYNYGANLPPLIDENCFMHPTTRKGRLRVQAERLMAENRQVPSVVIRAGDYFGSGTGSWFDLALVKKIASGKVLLPGLPHVATPWAYVPDLARAFVAVASRWEAEPQCLPQFSTLCYAGHQLSGADWVAALTPVARERGWLGAKDQLEVGGLPWGLFQALSFAVPLFRELAEMKYLPRTPHALNGNNLEALVGPMTSTPLPTAVRAAVNSLQKSGHLAQA